MSLIHAAALTLSTVGVLACSVEERRPDGLQPFPVDDSKTCSQVRSGSAQKGRVLVAGEIARCFPDGLSCALDDVSAFDGVCDAQMAVEARCEQGFWILTCTDRPEAGSP
jgi:hypothetical protein